MSKNVQLSNETHAKLMEVCEQEYRTPDLQVAYMLSGFSPCKKPEGTNPGTTVQRRQTRRTSRQTTKEKVAKDSQSAKPNKSKSSNSWMIMETMLSIYQRQWATTQDIIASTQERHRNANKDTIKLSGILYNLKQRGLIDRGNTAEGFKYRLNDKGLEYLGIKKTSDVSGRMSETH